MKILQFAFGSDPGNPFLPFNYVRNCVVYTGTHDNDTTIGWFEQLQQYEKDSVLRYLGCLVPEGINWSFIRVALSSIADLTIIPAQDLLGLGNSARMNFPGTEQGNWVWRYRPDAFNWEIGEGLRSLTTAYGRAPIK
jgi:4-alpha-glucanotransferase